MQSLSEFLTWKNFILWIILSIILYGCISFRMTMIFKHPPKWVRRKIEKNREKKEKLDAKF